MPWHDPTGPQSGSSPEHRTPGEALFHIAPSLRQDPTIGVSIVDADGRINFVNQRAAWIFLGRPPDEVIGHTLTDLFDRRWVDERLRLVETAIRESKPVVVRSMRRGVRLQSTLHPIFDDDAQHILALTVEGESDPDAGFDDVLIFESQIVDLGPLEPLTAREIEVLALIGQGLSHSEIARVMHRSVRTIEKHRESISKKLGEANRVTLGQIAQRAGLTVEDAARARTDRP